MADFYWIDLYLLFALAREQEKMQYLLVTQVCKICMPVTGEGGGKTRVPVTAKPTLNQVTVKVS